MKRTVFFVLLTLLMACTPKEILDTITDGDSLSSSEVAAGLKQALEIGIKEGAAELSQLNGYYESPYKILLPEEAQKLTDKLRVVPGFSDLEEEVNKKLNRAAEDAAKKAAPIFVDAIKGMTIEDAWNILKGDDAAATDYLHSKTYPKLYGAFQPVIHASLNKVGALDLWKEATTAYNKLPFVEPVNPDLDDHVTEKALVGLFDMVAKEEKAIRNDPAERVTELLRKVFAEQDA